MSKGVSCDIVVEIKIDSLFARYTHSSSCYLLVRNYVSVQSLKDSADAHFDLSEQDFSLFGLQNTTIFQKDETYLLQNLVNDAKPLDASQKLNVYYSHDNLNSKDVVMRDSKPLVTIICVISFDMKGVCEELFISKFDCYRSINIQRPKNSLTNLLLEPNGLQIVQQQLLIECENISNLKEPEGFENVLKICNSYLTFFIDLLNLQLRSTICKSEICKNILEVNRDNLVVLNAILDDMKSSISTLNWPTINGTLNLYQYFSQQSSEFSNTETDLRMLKTNLEPVILEYEKAIEGLRWNHLVTNGKETTVIDTLKSLQNEMLNLYNMCLASNESKFDLEALNDEIEALEKKFKRTKDSTLELRINNGKEALELFKKIEKEEAKAEDPLKTLQDELLVLYNSCLDINEPKFDLEALNDEIEALEKKFRRFKYSTLELRIKKGKEALELVKKIEYAKEIEHKQKDSVMLSNPLQDELVVLYNICLDNNETMFNLEALNDEIEALEKKFKRTKDSTLELRIKKGKEALELFRKIEDKEKEEKVKEEELINLSFNTIEAIKDLEQFASFCFKDTSSTSKEFLENVLKINDAITLHSNNLSSLLNHFSYSVDSEAKLRGIETQLKFQLASRNITLNSVRKHLDSILENTKLNEFTEVSSNEVTVDLDMLYKLVIQKNKDLHKNLKNLKQDIIFPFGFTGVGKTSFILFLCGISLKSNKMDRFEAKNLPASLSHLQIGQEAKSCTSVISATSHNSFTFLDGPGFKDTRGVMVDIVNVVAMYNVFSELQEFIPILFIGYHNFDLMHGQNVIELIERFVNLFNRGDGLIKLLDSMVVVFTKVDSNFSWQKLKALLQEHLVERQKNKPSVNAVIERIITGIDTNLSNPTAMGKVIVFRPEEEKDRSRFLEIFSRGTKFKHPQNHLQLELSNTSQLALSDSLLQLKLNIRLWLTEKDSQKLLNHFDLLATLSEHLFHVRNSLVDCVKIVQDFGIVSINESRNIIIDTFKPCAPLNEILITKFIDTRRFLEFVDKIKIKLKSNEIDIELITSESFDDWFLIEVSNYVEYTKKSIDFKEIGYNIDVCSRFKDLLCGTPLATRIELSIQDISSHIETIIRRLISDINGDSIFQESPIISFNRYQPDEDVQTKLRKFTKSLSEISLALDLQKYLGSFNIKYLYDGVLIKLDGLIENYQNEIVDYIKDYNFGEIDQRMITNKNFIDLVHKESNLVQLLIPVQDGRNGRLCVSDRYDVIVNTAIDRCRSLLIELKGNCESKSVSTLSDERTEERIYTVYNLINFDQRVQATINTEFTKCILLLENAVELIMEEPQNKILFQDGDNHKDRYQAIPIILKQLDNCKWLDKYSYGGRVEKKKDEVLKHANNSLYNLSQKIRVLFSRSFYNDVEEYYCLFEGLELRLKGFGTDYLEHFNNTKQYLIQEVIAIFELATKLVINENSNESFCVTFNFEEVDKYIGEKLNPLTKLCKLINLSSQYQATNKKLNDFFKEIIQHDINAITIDKTFNFSLYRTVLDKLKSLESELHYPHLPLSVKKYESALDVVNGHINGLIRQIENHFANQELEKGQELLEIYDKSIILLTHLTEVMKKADEFRAKLGKMNRKIYEEIEKLWNQGSANFVIIRSLIDRLPDNFEFGRAYNFIVSQLTAMKKNLKHDILSFRPFGSSQLSKNRDDFRILYKRLSDFELAHITFGTLKAPRSGDESRVELNSIFKFQEYEDEILDSLDVNLSNVLQKISGSFDNHVTFAVSEKIDFVFNLMKLMSSSHLLKMKITTALIDRLGISVVKIWEEMTKKVEELEASENAESICLFYATLSDQKHVKMATFKGLIKIQLNKYASRVKSAKTWKESNEIIERLIDLKERFFTEDLLKEVLECIEEAKTFLIERAKGFELQFIKLLDNEELNLDAIAEFISDIFDDSQIYNMNIVHFKNRIIKLSEISGILTTDNIISYLMKYILLNEINLKFKKHDVIEFNIIPNFKISLQDFIRLQFKEVIEKLSSTILDDQVESVSGLVCKLIDIKVLDNTHKLNLISKSDMDSMFELLTEKLRNFYDEINDGMDCSDLFKISNGFRKNELYDSLIQKLNLFTKKDPVYVVSSLICRDLQDTRRIIRLWLENLPDKLIDEWEKRNFNSITSILTSFQRVGVVEKLEDQFNGYAKNTVDEVFNDLQLYFEDLVSVTQNYFVDRKYKEFREYFILLENSTPLAILLGNSTTDIYDFVLNDISNKVEEAIKLNQEKFVADYLVELQELSFNIPNFSIDIKYQQQRLIDSFFNKNGEVAVSNLSSLLLSMNTPESLTVIASFKDFSYDAQEIFHRETVAQTLEWALGVDKTTKKPRFIYFNDLGIRNEGDETGELKMRNEWMRMDSLFQDPNNPSEGFFSSYYNISINLGIDSLVDTAKMFFREYETQPFSGYILVRAIAYISVVWSRLKSGGKKVTRLVPHPIQRLALYSLLEPTNYGNISNKLIQILPGEGKGVVLGILATFFALRNYEVQTICYSKYLSDRDYADFEEVFDIFSVKNVVFYSPISVLCEKIINRKRNIRDLVKSIIIDKATNTYENTSITNKNKKEVLLIDEVDVFLGEEFYGKTYNPHALLQNDDTINILKYIYQNRYTVKFSEVILLPEYISLMKSFDHLKELIDCEIRKMLEDVSIFQEYSQKKTPIVENNRIFYRCLDSTTNKKAFGYETVFQYFWKREQNEIIDDSFVKENVGIYIGCGKLLYSEIPFEFDIRMGISSSLKGLTLIEKDILKQYNFSKSVILPSIFGENKLNKDNYPFKPSVSIYNDKNLWYKSIVEKIQRKQGNGNALLVFFESITILEDFVSSFGNNIVQLQILDEKEKFKNEVIARSTTHGTVTLCTRYFGRGIDFICRDKRTLDAGGVHNIQTFIACSKAEQNQISRRTAIQGQSGSHEYILLHSDLKKYSGPTQGSIVNSSFENFDHDNLLSLDQKLLKMETIRNKKYLEEVGFLKRRNAEAMVEQKLANSFHDAVRNYDGKPSSFQNINKLICDINDPNRKISHSKYHIYLCLDESGSMHGGPWDELMAAVDAFIKRRIAMSFVKSGVVKDVISIITYATTGRVVWRNKAITSRVHEKITPVYEYTDFAAGLLVVKSEMDKDNTSFNEFPPILIFMSDGDCENGEIEMKSIKDTYPDCIIFVIGFSPNCNKAKMEKMSVAGSGEFYFGGYGELVKEFIKISERISELEFEMVKLTDTLDLEL